MTQRQRQRNRLITKVRYVVERTFGSQARWFGGKILCYRGLAKAHTWHILKTMAYKPEKITKIVCTKFSNAGYMRLLNKK